MKPTAAQLNPNGLQRSVEMDPLEPMGPREGETEYEYHLRALKWFKSVHGHMNVPQRLGGYILWEDGVSEELWSLWLGKVADQIRNQGRYKDKRAELEAAGFDFGKQESTPGNKKGWAVLKPALLAYQVHKDEDINTIRQTFVVPADGDNGKWPEETWTLKLGMVLYDIKRGKTYKANRAELEGMGLKYPAGV
jgi:hypothetical protein